jgi:hypothetical protein
MECTRSHGCPFQTCTDAPCILRMCATRGQRTFIISLCKYHQTPASQHCTSTTCSIFLAPCIVWPGSHLHVIECVPDQFEKSMFGLNLPFSGSYRTAQNVTAEPVLASSANRTFPEYLLLARRSDTHCMPALRGSLCHCQQPLLVIPFPITL